MTISVCTKIIIMIIFLITQFQFLQARQGLKNEMIDQVKDLQYQLETVKRSIESEINDLRDQRFASHRLICDAYINVL